MNLKKIQPKEMEGKSSVRLPHILYEFPIFLSPHLPGPNKPPSLLQTTPYDTTLLSPHTCLATLFLGLSLVFPPFSAPEIQSFLFPLLLSLSPFRPLSLHVSLSLCVCIYTRTHTHTQLSSSKILSIPTMSTVNSELRTSKCLA